jgi:NADPH:quinone reductase-like Zn-dependent oxidoreductase
MVFEWLKYPVILGFDVAGEVVEVGPDVENFKVGDRVCGNAVGMDKRSNKSSESGFQQYTILRTNLASPIPDNMSYEEACVIPLGFSTAACGLFMKDQLGLQYPSVPAKTTGKTLIVWGGSTSVGCNAIQLATAAGYEVITTSSPRNFEYVKKLGASHAFDYHKPDTVQQIITLLKDKSCAGAIAIGYGSTALCVSILAASQGNKFVAYATPPLDIYTFPTGILGIIATLMGAVWTMFQLTIKMKIKGVKGKFILGTDLMENEVGAAVYNDFLPVALAEGKFVPAPEPMVVGKGLEYLQEAMDLNKKGVSAKKMVVTL